MLAVVPANLMAAPLALANGTVKGVMHDAQGQPMAGATVQVRDSKNNIVATGVTDATGAFSIDVPPGEYMLQVLDKNQQSLAVFAMCVSVKSTEVRQLGTLKAAQKGSKQQAASCFGSGGFLGGTGNEVLVGALIAGIVITYFATRNDASPSK